MAFTRTGLVTHTATEILKSDEMTLNLGKMLQLHRCRTTPLHSRSASHSSFRGFHPASIRFSHINAM